MKRYIHFYTTLILIFGICSVFDLSNAKNLASDNRIKDIEVATTPPMGWNSFDAYDCRITEKEFKASVDVMAKELLPYGYEYAVIDYIWWHPDPGNWNTPKRKGHPNIRYKESGEPLHPEYITMDQYGRLLPSVKRFPSSAGGKGFKPLADYVHRKGLKFGIHIMRGIHRSATFLDTPIEGVNYTAKDISNTSDSCGWCNHMWGVDPNKPGAQEYYNSLFKLYAKWGVDFVKADDMMFPVYHKGEIEMMHKAIENCGRPMVLSLSCGEAPIEMAEHLQDNANMWRVSADFWDNWKSLKHNFDLLNEWSGYAERGAWPDADMIPVGKLSLDGRPHGPERMTKFTKDEQYTLITLWSIARSPLIIGADLLSMDDFTRSLLTNPEVLAVDQRSSGNRQLFDTDEKRAWVAKDQDGNLYLALFNLGDNKQKVEFDFTLENLLGEYKVRDLWKRKDVGVFRNKYGTVLSPHGCALYKLTKL